MIKAIFFDLDGVLVDSYMAWYNFFNQTLKHFGFPEITVDVFQKHWGQSTEDDVRIFLPGKTIAEVRSYFLDHIENFIDQVKVDPDAVEVLGYLSNHGLELACITNSHRDIVEAVLTDYELAHFFKVVLTADDLPPKPAPDMLIKACVQLKVRPVEAVFVGDTVTDIQAAEAAGCSFVGYRLDAKKKIIELRELLSLTLDE
ncbi:hypothetical protein A2Y85_06860 [candidate division WOR-3 bacterium RBG_13_43_14]|uniref:HAD family hydrolase n=1 Tax=candidate division WOR-3 bacterium RBG_13_43_14 TaxID=1802590 RepID=A0A1F4UDQ2_UNCW3|nr:MAG: hypothetical protein A2Y85_06860 [candidate division WOR-3 bacterium RBG_13_43_14]